MKKIIPYKSLFLLIILAFIFVVFKDAIHHQLTFNIHAPDLSGNGLEIKADILRSHLSLDSLLSRFNMWQSILIPLLIILTVSQYIFMKRCVIKNYIGKTIGNLYSKNIFKTKLYFSCINVVIFLLLFIIITVTSFLLGNFEFLNIRDYFPENSFLHHTITDIWTYLIYYMTTKTVAIFSLSMLAYYLADYFNSFIHASLSFLFIVWLATPVLHRFLPFYLIPLVSLMITSFYDVYFWQILSLNAVVWIMILLIKWRNKYEVD